MRKPRYGEQLFNNPAYFEQGFANRFLFAWPESNIGKRTLRGFVAGMVSLCVFDQLERLKVVPKVVLKTTNWRLSA